MQLCWTQVSQTMPGSKRLVFVGGGSIDVGVVQSAPVTLGVLI